MDSFGRFPKGYDEKDYKKNADDDYETSMYSQWVLTEDSPRIEQPEKIKLPLLPTQLASVASMIAMEREKYYATDDATYYTNATTLSNALGSGKSAVIITLITVFPIPTAPRVTPLPIEMEQGSAGRVQTVGARGIITRSYSVAMRPAIIFVGSGVLDQWRREFAKFAPHLKVFLIRDVFSLRKYYTDILYTSEIDKYDAILVKNGIITGKWEYLHGEQVPDSGTTGPYRSIYNILGYISNHVCYSRLINDDFDTIGLPPVSVNFNALHKWNVSCTRNEGTSNRIVHKSARTVEELTHTTLVSYKKLVKNDLLYTMFNVRVSEKFHSKYMTVGLPNMFRYLFRANVQKVAKLINLMAGDKVSSIMEALNGDAVEEAAKLAGIETSSVTGIFKSLLKRNFEQMTEAGNICALINSYYSKVNWGDLPQLPDDSDDTFTRLDLRKGRKVEWRYPGFNSLVKEELERWTLVYKEMSTCIDKFRYTVKNGDCQVCCVGLADEDSGCCILPCCYEIVHMGCAINGCRFSSRIMPGTGGQAAVIGYCPFDKSHEVAYNNLVYLGKNFDLGELADEKNILKAIESGEEKKKVGIDEKKSPADASEPDPTRTKNDAIYDIIIGRRPAEQVKSDLLIPEVMQGRSLGPSEYLRESVQTLRNTLRKAGYTEMVTHRIMQTIDHTFTPRVLLFAAFDETLQKLQEDLKRRGVDYVRVMGTSSQIDSTFLDFSEGRNNVLLINSTRYSAGRNLQQATDLVFTHMLLNKEILKQVGGRIQREGRSCDANIHFTIYETETNDLDSMMR